MPGITGIISKIHQKENQAHLQQMVKSMCHEAFYNNGTWHNDDLGIYIGWVCHEGSFTDCMPVLNEKKNIVLVFHGENFTDLELFDKLKAKHHKFDSSNASYLIHLYEEKGMDFLQDLNGWFSGILIDIPNKQIVLFNDRYGMQRIFYYEGKEAFYFASEAKALLKVCPELRQIDMRSMGEYLSCDCTLEYRTLFKNIYLLPGAAAWQFDQKGFINKKSYFSSDVWEKQPWLEKEFFYEKLKETFSKILLRYFRSNQPIAISLTGGLDTRIIMANAELPSDKYPCYTFGGMYRDCSDVQVARRVALACQQEHITLRLDRNFLSEFPMYAEKTVYISDGYFDVSGAPEIYLNRMARDVAPIRMTGNYGGEVLRAIGGKLKANPPNPTLFSDDFNKYLKDAAVTVVNINNNEKHPITFNLFSEIPCLRNHGFVVEQSQLTPRTPYMDNDLVALMYRASIEGRNNKEFSLRLIADGNTKLKTIPTDRGVGGNKAIPFSIIAQLYNQFFVKAEYAYNYGMPQWLANLDFMFKFMHFEKLFLGRHKFAHFRIWYRDELSSYIKAILLDQTTLTRPYLNRRELEVIIKKHTNGYGNYTTEISKLLTVELMHRSFIDK